MSTVPFPMLCASTSSGVHAGRTLALLGHAAEYLATAHGFSGEVEKGDEAVRILMRLSRRVFQDLQDDAGTSDNVHRGSDGALC